MYKTFDIDYSDITHIKTLWEKNRIYHEVNSEYFKELYRSICFKHLTEGLKDIPEDELKITVTQKDETYIGYCISVITNNSGELKSLHVDKDFRGRGIGRELVGEHLQWLKKKNCKSIGVKVSYENDPTISFYKRLGFFPNTLHMQLN